MHNKVNKQNKISSYLEVHELPENARYIDNEKEVKLISTIIQNQQKTTSVYFELLILKGHVECLDRLPLRNKVNKQNKISS